MCGGSLDVSEGASVATCDYCGTRQTVPTVDDGEIRELFNRASFLRMKGEFDRAERIYEKLIEKSPNEAEAYWGLVLCKYGIEYVEDPKTLKRLPTCHRTSFEAVIADASYQTALSHADEVQKVVYESEAKAIDSIQRAALAISQSEEPYDVFICYKETDESGQRTRDSVIADEIYYELTDAGYKVFFAPVTLKTRLGSEYEPYIFAALSSARVLLAIGTKPEYFNAVWVKNEWSRFLKMMQGDRSKKLIPCYRDMDAYDLPDEFAHLQALNMSGIGFVRELINGIKTLIVKEAPSIAPVTAETPVSNTDSGEDAGALIRRAFLFLEDSDLKNASEYCDRALDIDPENGNAYLCLMLIELKLISLEALAHYDGDIKLTKNYGKVCKYCDKATMDKIAELLSDAKDRKRLAELDAKYDEAVKAYESAYTEEALNAAKDLFLALAGHRDADEMAKKCASEWAERVERASAAFELWASLEPPVYDSEGDMDEDESDVRLYSSVLDELVRLDALRQDYHKAEADDDRAYERLCECQRAKEALGFFAPSQTKKEAKENLAEAERKREETQERYNEANDAFYALVNELNSRYPEYQYGFEGLDHETAKDRLESAGARLDDFKKRTESYEAAKASSAEGIGGAVEALRDPKLLAVIARDERKLEALATDRDGLLTSALSSRPVVSVISADPRLSELIPSHLRLKYRVYTGDTLVFGHYRGEPISWIVLSNNGAEARMIPAEPLCNMKHGDYLAGFSNYSWDKSMLKLLCDGMASGYQYFNEEERKMFAGATVPSAATVSSRLTQCKSTWWLRDAGGLQGYAQYVGYGGKVNKFGDKMSASYGFRPIVTFKLI